LSGTALDWAVAKAYGKYAGDMPTYYPIRIFVGTEKEAIVGYQVYLDPEERDEFGMIAFEPSTNWGQAGPIIDREKIEIKYLDVCVAQIWYRDGIGSDNIVAKGVGETSLIAAMRCYVASKLGNEVEIPLDLAQKGQEENKSHSESVCVIAQGRKFIKILSSNRSCDECVARENIGLCDDLPECFGVEPVFYIFKEVPDR
jgi:hypothetical protein